MILLLQGLLAAFAFIFLLIRFMRNHRKYWEEREVPGPTPSLLMGNLKELMRRDFPAPLQIREWTKKYGSVYGIQEGWQNVLVVSDPDMLQDLFIKKFENFYGRKNFPLIGDVDKAEDVHVFAARGLRWKRLRTLSNPSFTVNSLKKIKSTVEDSVLAMVEHIEKHVDTGNSFNIHLYYQELTMDVIARIAMGQAESRQFNNDYIDLVKAVFDRPANNPFLASCRIAPAFTGIIRKLAFATAKLRGMPFAFLKERIQKAVEKRREDRMTNGEDHEAKDFIDLFLDAEAEVELSSGTFERSNIKVEKKLLPGEIVMQCFVFLLAGFDTTANSLAYASYCLAKHPEVRKKVQQEIDEICVDDEVSFEQINQLKYLDIVVKEALRLYPLGAFANSRECMKATTLGKVAIEKGTNIMADAFSVHYNKQIWGEDADQFRPERWENAEPRHQMAWFPFGAGPRICIGKKLADMEEKLAFVHLLRRYDIVAAEDTEKTLKLKGASTISPESVTVQIRTRIV